MVRFVIKAGFGCEALIRDNAALIWDPALIRGNQVRLSILSVVSKNQNKLSKCCIKCFVLKTDIIAKR